MISTRRFRGPLFTALVCLLAVGTFLLAHRAKSSQYQSAASTGYLAKAVKMSGDRVQTSALAIPSLPVVLGLTPPLFAARAPRPDDDPCIPAPVPLEAFRNRPPPSVA